MMEEHFCLSLLVVQLCLVQHQKHQAAPNTERHPAAVTSHRHQSPAEYQLDLLHLNPCPLHSTHEHRLQKPSVEMWQSRLLSYLLPWWWRTSQGLSEQEQAPPEASPPTLNSTNLSSLVTSCLLYSFLYSSSLSLHSSALVVGSWTCASSLGL